MIINRILNRITSASVPQAALPGKTMQEFFTLSGRELSSSRMVTAETAKNVSTAYRCVNVISDDIASMPMQVFDRVGSNIRRIYPDGVSRNLAWQLEQQPNRWMNPFIWKKTIINWLILWGNAYIWAPPGPYRELFILPASAVTPALDAEGNKWYQVKYPNNDIKRIPDVEMVHLMINSSDGLVGKSVLTYARETLSRQLGAHETEDQIFGGGLVPTALLWMNTTNELTKESREAAKKSFLEAAGGGVAVFDNRVSKFETLTMKPADAQFLEGVQLTDTDLANFFGVPLYKLNMGKQSYESNAQQDLEYLKTTLNPYLVQWEQDALLKWVSEDQQPFVYVRFNRESVLQTDASTRASYLEKKIMSGQLTPNEARQIEDMSSYAGGDRHYIPANMIAVEGVGQ